MTSRHNTVTFDGVEHFPFVIYIQLNETAQAIRMKFDIIHRCPTVSEYNWLRELVEWPVMDERLVKVGLANSLFAVVILDAGGSIAAMGRIVGDGALYFHISDVIVRPDLQRHGLGRMIMHELMRWLEGAGGKNTNIGLMSSKGREEFYRSFGFIDRPGEKFGAGMIIIK
jgi:GNAT superfamily N-acetyltransferase